MVAKYKSFIFTLNLLLITFIPISYIFPQTNPPPSPSSGPPEKLTLVHAAMCKTINGYSPKNTAIIFSIEIGTVSCFTSFDPVPEEINIYQKWFHRDKLTSKQKRRLKPPRWSTFSSIQLREEDKGPWRVEISDEKGNMFQILRFSIVD